MTGAMETDWGATASAPLPKGSRGLTGKKPPTRSRTQHGDQEVMSARGHRGTAPRPHTNHGKQQTSQQQETFGLADRPMTTHHHGTLAGSALKSAKGFFTGHGRAARQDEEKRVLVNAGRDCDSPTQMDFMPQDIDRSVVHRPQTTPNRARHATSADSTDFASRHHGTHHAQHARPGTAALPVIQFGDTVNEAARHKHDQSQSLSPKKCHAGMSGTHINHHEQHHSAFFPHESHFSDTHQTHHDGQIYHLDPSYVQCDSPRAHHARHHPTIDPMNCSASRIAGIEGSQVLDTPAANSMMMVSHAHLCERPAHVKPEVHKTEHRPRLPEVPKTKRSIETPTSAKGSKGSGNSDHSRKESTLSSLQLTLDKLKEDEHRCGAFHERKTGINRLRFLARLMGHLGGKSEAEDAAEEAQEPAVDEAVASNLKRMSLAISDFVASQQGEKAQQPLESLKEHDEEIERKKILNDIDASFLHFASGRLRSGGSLMYYPDFENFVHTVQGKHSLPAHKLRDIFYSKIEMQTDMAEVYSMTHAEASKGICIKTFKMCLHEACHHR